MLNYAGVSPAIDFIMTPTGVSMPARTLEDAFNALDPLRPIRPEDVSTLYVQRPHSPVNRLRAQLVLSQRPQKVLFVGHRGAGKSSEMAYLSTLLQQQHLSLFVPLYDIFRSPDLSHIELVFAITLRLLRLATDESVVPRGVVTENWEKLLERVYQPLRQWLFGADKIAADQEPTISLKLSVLVAELETKIGTESYTRNQVRERFAGRVADLLDQIDLLAHQLESKMGRRLLLIVEDLDKFNVAATRQLFLDHARTLTAPYPSVIYSFPVAMRYDNAFREIAQSFDQVHILPNIGIKHRNGSVDADGRRAMWEVLLKRLEDQLFAAGVLDSMVTLSGGHVKTVIQLGRQAVLNAVVDGAAQVQADHLEAARAGLRDDYMVLLKKEQIELLRQLHEDEDKDLLDTTQAKQELLFNGSLLEFGNTRGPWADVHPIIEELLERKWE